MCVFVGSFDAVNLIVLDYPYVCASGNERFVFMALGHRTFTNSSPMTLTIVKPLLRQDV